MDKKHEAKLFKDFPEFFKHKEDMKASLMGFGFETDNGWYDLIYKLCVDIKAQLIKEHGEVPDEFYVTQAKEKFASLRYYISGASTKVFDLINTAEKDSTKICEICGKPGEILCKAWWFKALCPQCAKKKNFNVCPER